MRRLSFFLLVIVLLSVSGITAQDTPTEEPASGDTFFQLIDSSPADGASLTPGQGITLYFDRPVDCASAEAALTLEPALAGSLTCSADNASLTWTPASDYAAGAAYTLTIGDALRAGDGSSLAEPISLSFLPVGALEVTEVLPADGASGITGDAAVTVIFNRPVVPLSIVEEMDDLPDPLTIAPAVEGAGEWLNTSIYVFRPTPAFAAGQTYTVTVNAGLQAADGTALPADYSWTFTTSQPEIVSVTPQDLAENVALDASVQITFTHPMDEASVEAAFNLRVHNANEGIAGAFVWTDDGLGLLFDPDERLALGTRYVVEIDSANALAASGGAPLTGENIFSFTTVPAPAILNTSPEDGERAVSPYTSFTIFFASPMDADTIEDKITVEPEPWREADDYYSDWDDSYSLSFPVEPSTSYTITIAPGMEDIYGNTIDEGRVVTFFTAPYEPDVMLQTPGQMGFYNAHNPETQLFLTHRNVSRVNLSLYDLSLEQFGAIVTDENSYQALDNFLPARTDLRRQWAIPSDTPENQRRYELLDLGAADSNPAATCEGAPASRLKIDDVAVVTLADEALRVRSAPPDGEVIARIYRDYQLPIIGGPECFNGLLWWEVRLRDDSTGWVAEGDATEYYLDVSAAAATTEATVSETEDGGPLAPGVYFLTATSPETAALQYRPTRHMMIVGTANLTMKLALDNVLVWATNVDTGEPLADAPITIYGQGWTELGSGVTDADGLVRVDIPRLDNLYAPVLAVLDSDDEFGLGYNQWVDGIDPWMFGQNFQSQPEPYRAYLYTDRPVYRPDQPVYFRGVVRARDDVQYTLPSFTEIPVGILNESGDVVFEQTLPLTPYGTFNATFDIAADAPLGHYRIIAQLPSEEVDQYYWGEAQVGFDVAEYRLPEFQVEVTPEQDAVVQDSTIRVLVDSTFYFGGAVSDAAVEYSVVGAPYFFDYQGGGRYSFVHYDADGGPSEYYGGGGEQIANGSATTDASGQAIIEIPADLKDSTQSQVFTIEAVVTDESGQAVAGRAEVVVHQGTVYVGVAPRDYVGLADDETTIDLIAVDWDSEPVTGQSLDVEVVERRWSSVQEQDEYGRTTWSWEVEEIPVTEATVATDAGGKAEFTFTPPNGGVFKITARTRDSEGNRVVASNTMWVSSSDYIAWRQQNSNRIDLVSDANAYEVGDTAEILIASPFQGATEALITVERGDVLHAERVTMASNSFIYRLPIEADYAPNVYVSVMLVKGVDENNPVAAFRMGLIQLAVDPEQKELSLTIEPSVEQAGPGDTVTFTVTATDFSGQPVQAEVGVGLTDAASLAIGDPNSIPLMSFFYGQQGLSVQTSTPLTINTDQLTQTVLDTIKGGGGGFGEGGIFDIREEFVDTAYWNATLTTDENGVATFDVTLPDNLTTWRLDARAVTSGEDGNLLVGQTTYDLLSTKPLLIRPVTPRFFVVGDEVSLAAVVNNNTEDEQEVEVTLEASGLTFQGDAVQTVTIPAGGRARIDWPVLVEDVAAIDLTFYASGNGGDYTDASKPPLGQGDARLLPVFKFEAPETVGTGGVLREGGSVTEAIALPRTFDVTQGELTVSLEPSLAATTLDALDYLRNYPYQCTEQTVSRFLPNIMTYRAFDAFGLADAELEAGLDFNVRYAVQRLYAQQHVDGGWGWFVQDVSDPLVTAYALLGLYEADQNGFDVTASAISRAQQYLTGTMIVPSQSVDTWKLNRQAFVLYVLARTGAPDVARTATLYESRERLDIYAHAFLAMALNSIDADDSRVDTLASDLVSSAILSATGAHWEEASRDYWNWNTDTRSTAIVLQALTQIMPESDLIPNVVRWLMVARQADAWETTQETAWSIMALTDWMVVTGELTPDYTFSASLNGQQLAEGTATSDNVREATELVVQVQDMLQDEANRLVIERSDGDGNLYYTAHLRAFLPVPEIEPLNRGLIVERRYTLADDASNAPITDARVGDLVTVRLTVIAPNDLHYVVIEDPIPAGSDAVNPDLATSQQTGTQPELNPQNPLSQGWGWWWFSNIEYRDEKVVLFSSYLPAGTYEYVYTIRAGLPGTFNVIPTTGYEFYFPEVYGRGAGSTFTIAP